LPALAAAVRVEAAAEAEVVVVRAAQAPRMVSDMAQIMAAGH